MHRAFLIKPQSSGNILSSPFFKMYLFHRRQLGGQGGDAQRRANHRSAEPGTGCLPPHAGLMAADNVSSLSPALFLVHGQNDCGEERVPVTQAVASFHEWATRICRSPWPCYPILRSRDCESHWRPRDIGK